ncbi:MAG: hypothetical protein LC799_13110 [Actinobacteria bacterium]|nr:hypothetical protein [Actinomycetota bacterium]
MTENRERTARIPQAIDHDVAEGRGAHSERPAVPPVAGIEVGLHAQPEQQGLNPERKRRARGQSRLHGLHVQTSKTLV